MPPLSLEDSDLEIISRIIYQFNMFPFRIVKAPMIHFINGDVSDDILLDTFLQFLPEKEADMVKSFMNGNNDSEMLQALVDVLVFEKPTKKNIHALLMKTVKTCL